MERERVGIYDIRVELEKLARAGVFQQRTADACEQAAELLKAMREVLITNSEDEIVPDDEKVKRLRWILSMQGEG